MATKETRLTTKYYGYSAMGARGEIFFPGRVRSAGLGGFLTRGLLLRHGLIDRVMENKRVFMAFPKGSGRPVDSMAVPVLRRAEALRLCCWLGGCLVVAAATLGCGKGDSVAFAPVEGRVTLDGKPLESGEIRFQPDTSQGNKGPLSAAVLGAGGSFKLRGPGARVGAVPGPHRVYFVSPFKDEAPEPPLFIDGKYVQADPAAGVPVPPLSPSSWKVPRKCLAAETSELTATVTEGTANVIEFNLESSVPRK
jgi:hypothetical protein